MPHVPMLTEHLGYRLRQVSNFVSHGFARKLAARDVTVAEWGVMRVLYDREPTPPSLVADEMGMTRGAISKLADRLIAKGLIGRESDPSDGRAQFLSLTEKGARFVPELAALADANEAECFAHLTAAERGELMHVLEVTIARLGLKDVPID